MGMPRILVVDDEKEIADLLEIYLKNEGYQVFKFYNSLEAFEKIKALQIDLAILDVMMPELDGFSFCQKVREFYTFPIIFVTAKVEDMDKIKGLTLGADDYVVKPFEPLEVVARVKAQLKRSLWNGKPLEENRIQFRGILIDSHTHEFFFHDKKIELTKTEFELLWVLCKERGNVVSNEALFFQVWKEKYFLKDNNTIMVHIRHLREKMHDIGKKPTYIKTIYGVGYKIEK